MPMLTTAPPLPILRNAPIPTWFGIGGGADRFLAPTDTDQLKAALALDAHLRILGDGANLLIDDDGVGELVIALTAPHFTRTEWDDKAATVRVGAGANLPKLINESVRRGLGGLETLGGIPASLGGAARMNAGGAFGEIATSIARVHGLDRQGREVTLARNQINFSYRHSGLDDLIITAVDLQLTPQDPAALRQKHREVMAYKSKSQPMADRSAGCVFKNPTLTEDLKDIGARGTRVSAGMLIDKAGGKGMTNGGASVSQRHGNFIVTDPKTAKARHVIDLMDQVAARVHDAFGVALVPEVVIWQRTSSR